MRLCLDAWPNNIEVLHLFARMVVVGTVMRCLISTTIHLYFVLCMISSRFTTIIPSQIIVAPAIAFRVQLSQPSGRVTSTMLLNSLIVIAVEIFWFSLSAFNNPAMPAVAGPIIALVSS